MKFYFIVEDEYGPAFIKKLFQRKVKESVFSGSCVGAKKVPVLGSKPRRIVSIKATSVDRIIILADADGLPRSEKESRIFRNIDKKYRGQVRIVLLDWEIEEWICYSKGLTINGKPSEILKSKLRTKYEKNELPDYAARLNCAKLMTCKSFRRLLDALNA